MRKNTVLLAVAFVIAGMVSVSCGGDSGTEGSDSGAGTTSTTAGTAGASTTGGTSNPSGGTSATAGTTSNTSGNATGGTNASGGTTANGGTTSNGGTNTAGTGGTNPFMLPDCPAGTMDGGMCTRSMNGQNSCQLDANTVCNCRRPNGGGTMSTYRCFDITPPGAGGQTATGGAGSGLGNATCGDAPKTGDACTNGPGGCEGSNNCFCNFQSKVQCF